MLQITGYLGGYDEEIVRQDVDFLVTCCGHYRLLSRPYFETIRSEGRADYQLMYAVGGKFTVCTEGQELSVKEGQGILFFPGSPQKYYYQLKDSPDVFWMHFTGGRVREILDQCGLREAIFDAGIRQEYPVLWERMIRELQLRRAGFELLCSGCGMELLAMMARSDQKGPDSATAEIMEEILARFHRDFRQELSVAELAREYGMSECWLIRAFKARTGQTPQRYLTGIRLGQARELLSSSPLNVGEIAAFCGYENPLYFSRIFRKYTGASPSDYRREKRLK
ncbi:MAG: helix-turn-helix domain-containing protein [Candidatus Merdivicinus sp.]|jgi:AraC family transcriptional regulator of arabinose operon